LKQVGAKVAAAVTERYGLFFKYHPSEILFCCLLISYLRILTQPMGCAVSIGKSIIFYVHDQSYLSRLMLPACYYYNIPVGTSGMICACT